MEAKSGASLHHPPIQAVRIIFKAVDEEFLHRSHRCGGSGYVDKASHNALQASWRDRDARSRQGESLPRGREPRVFLRAMADDAIAILLMKC